MNRHAFITLALTLFTIAGCDNNEPRAVRGFVLPSGNVEVGKSDFANLGCTQCHTVANTDLPAHPGPGPMRFNIELGGEVIKVKSYGELLTAVVNPGHTLARQYVEEFPIDEQPQQSPMPRFESTMTVRELIDVVEFLHTTYAAAIPEYHGYMAVP
ncbi:MAG: hypothetical protein AAF384_11775 [Pseudomonadota bacterium]